MTREEALRAALARLAWMADAGHQFITKDTAVHRELFEHIRDYAREALQKDEALAARAAWLRDEAVDERGSEG